MIEKVSSYINRIFFGIAFLSLIVAIIQWFLLLFGWTLCYVPYQPGRILEFSAIFLLFVIALILREIRENFKSKNT